MIACLSVLIDTLPPRIVAGGAVLAAGLLLAACSNSYTVREPTATPKTSFEPYVPEHARRYTLAAGEAAIKPQPITRLDAHAPVYPPTLARPGRAPVVVKARLVFAADGHVKRTDIVSNSDAGQHHALYAAAVRAATRDWVFSPLYIEHPVQHGDQGPTIRREAKPFSLWFKFRFVMVDGKPVVKTIRR